MTFHATHWLPGRLREDGTREPPEPCPDILDTEMACRLLLLDKNKNPSQALCEFKARHGITQIQGGKSQLFRRDTLLKALERIDQ